VDLSVIQYFNVIFSVSRELDQNGPSVTLPVSSSTMGVDHMTHSKSGIFVSPFFLCSKA